MWECTSTSLLFRTTVCEFRLNQNGLLLRSIFYKSWCVITAVQMHRLEISWLLRRVIFFKLCKDLQLPVNVLDRASGASQWIMGPFTSKYCPDALLAEAYRKRKHRWLSHIVPEVSRIAPTANLYDVYHAKSFKTSPISSDSISCRRNNQGDALHQHSFVTSSYQPEAISFQLYLCKYCAQLVKIE